LNTNLCGTTIPSEWTLGTIFTAGIPPLASEVGWSGDPTCITIDQYPLVASWKYEQSSCNQTDVIDDPYCPSPYLSVTYRPEELYTLTSGNDTITRVLYHMSATIEEMISTTDGGTIDPIDFMFIVDHSGSMFDDIGAIVVALPSFAQTLQDSGTDIRFGLTIYAYGRTDAGPNGSFPVNPLDCPLIDVPIASQFFDGLDYSGSTAQNGFTTNISDISLAMNQAIGWRVGGSAAPGFSVVQFANEDPRFVWRPGVKRVIFLITDTTCTESSVGCFYPNQESLAIQSCLNNNCTVIVAISNFGLCYENLSIQTGWEGGSFPVQGTPDANGKPSYDVTFNFITEGLTTNSKIRKSVRVVERNEIGYSPTFFKEC